DEGDMGRALALVRAAQRAESSPGGYSSYSYAGAHVPSLDEQVAKAAEETRPRDAIDIYRHRVERLIAGRGRPAYQQAAQLLRRIRDLYTRLGEQEAWARYLAALRDRNRALRAFKEELTKAGL